MQQELIWMKCTESCDEADEADKVKGDQRINEWIVTTL